MWVNHYSLGWYNKKLTYSYDWQGNITQKGYYDYDGSSSPYYTSYTYDKAGRLQTVNTSPNSNMSGSTQEGLYTYLANGKVKRLQLAASQGVDYTYNSRDWLTMINQQNLNTSQDPGHDGPGGSGVAYVDKFGEVIGYDEISNIGASQGATAQYNGNISWQMYNMGVNYSSTPLVGWSYDYDKTNRLTKADFGYYSGGWATTNAYDCKSYTYDKIGNITSLLRYGSGGTAQDNLVYHYNSNSSRLTSLSGTLNTAYTYDDNGNVLSDASRGIAFIIYDTDNLPVTVYTTGGQAQVYSYDVTGNRIR
ncbi:MAG: hypothetical protein ACYC56_13255, partial [Candidatus Aquicultor sp.]